MSVTPIERLSAPPQHSTHAQAHPAERACERVPAAKIVLWTVLFQLAWHFRKLPDILLQGTMPDPDDFLRLHQVRGWLAGQGWFDVSVARMNPPAGADMHWTRLADAPLAVLVQLFDLFTDATTAERLTAIVWPTLLLIATVFVVIGICERVTQGVNRLLALLFTVTCVYAIAEFAPGRIDHHGLQILLFCLALLGLVHREATWGPALTGATIALSIAIGIDAFLILLAFPLLFGLEWAVDGKQRARRLLLLAAGIGATALLAFVAFVPKAQ